jgi:hypothetical protein
VLRVAVSQRNRVAISSLPMGPASVPPLAHPFKSPEVFFYFVKVQCAAKGMEPLLVYRKPRLQELQLVAINHHTGVQKLLPFHPGHHADNGVFKYLLFLHAALRL